MKKMNMKKMNKMNMKKMNILGISIFFFIVIVVVYEIPVINAIDYREKEYFAKDIDNNTNSMQIVSYSNSYTKDQQTNLKLKENIEVIFNITTNYYMDGLSVKIDNDKSTGVQPIDSYDIFVRGTKGKITVNFPSSGNYSVTLKPYNYVYGQITISWFITVEPYSIVESYNITPEETMEEAENLKNRTDKFFDEKTSQYEREGKCILGFCMDWMYWVIIIVIIVIIILFLIWFLLIKYFIR